MFTFFVPCGYPHPPAQTVPMMPVMPMVPSPSVPSAPPSSTSSPSTSTFPPTPAPVLVPPTPMSVPFFPAPLSHAPFMAPFWSSPLGPMLPAPLLPLSELNKLSSSSCSANTKPRTTTTMTMKKTPQPTCTERPHQGQDTAASSGARPALIPIPKIIGVKRRAQEKVRKSGSASVAVLAQAERKELRDPIYAAKLARYRSKMRRAASNPCGPTRSAIRRKRRTERHPMICARLCA